MSGICTNAAAGGGLFGGPVTRKVGHARAIGSLGDTEGAGCRSSMVVFRTPPVTSPGNRSLSTAVLALIEVANGGLSID